jgi:hypothetical protein
MGLKRRPGSEVDGLAVLFDFLVTNAAPKSYDALPDGTYRLRLTPEYLRSIKRQSKAIQSLRKAGPRRAAKAPRETAKKAARADMYRFLKAQHPKWSDEKIAGEVASRLGERQDGALKRIRRATGRKA